MFKSGDLVKFKDHIWNDDHYNFNLGGRTRFLKEKVDKNLVRIDRIDEHKIIWLRLYSGFSWAVTESEIEYLITREYVDEIAAKLEWS